jgi:hypothetical protein
MDIGETMVYPFTEGYKSARAWVRKRLQLPAAAGQQPEPAE